MVSSDAMDGVLVVDKPAGPTSFDVVRRIRTLLGVKKVGHTGTLDPFATGVLPLCLGEATKVAGYVLEGDKAYDAGILLGAETDTQDVTGRVVREAAIPPLTRESIEAALSRFRGTFAQTPPMYSAVKVKGKRLYELAREGKEIERPARQVTVHELVLQDFSADRLSLRVRCSKGFFVRTLAEDLGRALGTAARLERLRRLHSGPFSLAQALSPDALEALVKEGGNARVQAHLLDLDQALAELTPAIVTSEQARAVLHGVPIEVAGPPGLVRVKGADGNLLAVADRLPNGRLSYRRVMKAPRGPI